jgi:hypothetical protein
MWDFVDFVGFVIKAQATSHQPLATSHWLDTSH